MAESSVADRASKRRDLLKQGAAATTKAVNNTIAGKDPVSQDDIEAAIIAQLPPEAQEVINDIKKVEGAYDKVFPKDKDGNRDFSAAGATRTALDLLSQYGGKDVQKALAARQKALDLASKLGINVPSIEDLVNFDWDKLSKTLSNLEFKDIVNIDNFINNLEGELMKFLPPGLAENMKYLKAMLKEFGLPSSLDEAYKSLTDPAVAAVIPPQDQNVYQPGVFVDTHRMARVGNTYMAHGALPLLGTGAKSVFIEGKPVWRAMVDKHACSIPFTAPPAPDGPNFCSTGFKKVLVEGQNACRHDLDAIDKGTCGPTNVFLTQLEAQSAWERLKASMKRVAPSKATTTPPGGSGGTGDGEGEDKEKDKDKDKDKKGKENIPPIAAVAIEGTTAKRNKAGFYQQGGVFTISGAASKDPDGTIANYGWYVYGTGPTGIFTVTPLGGVLQGAHLDHLYVQALESGKYTVGLVVVDNDDARSTNLAEVTFQIGSKPIAVIKPVVVGQTTKDPFILRSESYDPDNLGATDHGITSHEWNLKLHYKITGQTINHKMEGKSIQFRVDQIVNSFTGSVVAELRASNDVDTSDPVFERFEVDYDFSLENILSKFGKVVDSIADVIRDTVNGCIISKVGDLFAIVGVSFKEAEGIAESAEHIDEYVEKLNEKYHDVVKGRCISEIRKMVEGFAVLCMDDAVKALIRNDPAMSGAEKEWSEAAVDATSFVEAIIESIKGKVLRPAIEKAVSILIGRLLDAAFERWKEQKIAQWKSGHQ